MRREKKGMQNNNTGENLVLLASDASGLWSMESWPANMGMGQNPGT